jgi:glycosyltransferase involved in cell wall biosynthesis
MNPLVSIIIPVYNGSNFLKEAIDSALAQTYSNIEVVVINDGSTDEGKTRDVVLTFGDKIRYFEKENGGVASALNIGVSESRGEYLSWLSHDDVYSPSKIKDQVEYAILNNFNLVYSNYIFIDSLGQLLQEKTQVKELSSKNFLFQLLSGYPINGCTTLIHRSIFNAIGHFHVDLETTQDYDFWFRCHHKFNFEYLDLIVLKSRIHPNQDSVSNPRHHSECDELYTRIARAVINSKNDLLSEQELYFCFKSIIMRGYLSAAFMIMRGIKNKKLKVKVILLVIKFYVKGKFYSYFKFY